MGSLGRVSGSGRVRSGSGRFDPTVNSFFSPLLSSFFFLLSFFLLFFFLSFFSDQPSSSSAFADGDLLPSDGRRWRTRWSPLPFFSSFFSFIFVCCLLLALFIFASWLLFALLGVGDGGAAAVGTVALVLWPAVAGGLGRARPAATCGCQRDQNVMAAKLLGSKRNFKKV
ncbi:uncharacterized protein LOC105766004 isoform X1 [Gossypium raimondii]|uniref:uncharacterized protein LOC105766004 isoform X1 n=1 Tax=Gossypium raimondii TaxID=29730 RepID=UPI00063AE9B9|nr:uncharacterized protein LOC105766004 isoform X1 [Gossypium raimondii]